MRSRPTRLSVVASLLLAAATVAGAQPVPVPMNEITPFGAFSAGGDPDPSAAFGVTYSRFLNATQSLDFTVQVQSTTVETERGSFVPEVDLNIEYYHFGGRYTPARPQGRVRPYVSMSAGLSRFSASPGDDEAGFSIGFGGGADLPLSRNVALRLDARLFSTIGLTSAVIYCEPQFCTSFATGNVFTQFTGSAGLVVKF